MAHKKNDKKKHIRPFRFFLLLFAVFLIGTGAATYSRYVLGWTPGRTAVEARSFYFTSDLLGEGDSPVYQISDFNPGETGDKIVFKLRNYADEFRVSKTDMSYTVSAEGTNEKTVAGIFKAENSQLKEETISLTVPEASFENNMAVITVTAVVSSPYEQSISAVFELYRHITAISYSVSDSVGSNTLVLTVTTSDLPENNVDGTNVIVKYPSGLLPDRTDRRLVINAELAECSFLVKANAQYTITFFKTAPNSQFRSEQFTVN